MEAAQVSLEPCVVCHAMAGMCCRVCKQPICDPICAVEHKIDAHRGAELVKARKDA